MSQSYKAATTGGIIDLTCTNPYEQDGASAFANPGYGHASVIIGPGSHSLTFQTYINSAVNYREIVAKSGADILLSNHTRLDGSATLPLSFGRRGGALARGVRASGLCVSDRGFNPVFNA